MNCLQHTLSHILLRFAICQAAFGVTAMSPQLGRLAVLPRGERDRGLAGRSELGLWLLQTSSGQLCWKQCIGCVRLPPSLLMSSKKTHPTLRRLEGSVLRARLLSITLVTVPIPVLFSRRTQLQRILLWKCLGSQGRERIGETSYVPSLPPSVPKRSLFHPEGPP